MQKTPNYLSNSRYINHTGAWELIPPSYYDCWAPFCDGLAVAGVCQEDEMNERGYTTDWECTGEGYIDKTGAIVIPPRFREVDDFSEGLAHVQIETGEYVFIDTEGAVHRIISLLNRYLKSLR